MVWIADIGIVVLLVIVVFQDLKQRQISWLLLPFLLVLFLVKGLFFNPVAELLHDTFFNIGFIAVQILILTVYVSIKNRKFRNIIDSQIGLGDLLFFVIIGAAFSPVNFIFFYISGLLFTLTIFVAYSALIKKTEKEIPLAGAMAFLMIILILMGRWSTRFSFYNDDFLTGWFINK